MSFEIVLRSKAQIDLDEIFVWYEGQKPDLGYDFINEFESALHKIGQNPYHASYFFKEGRSLSLKRFPYQIICKIDAVNEQIRILAIIHHSRNPELRRKRLEE